MGDFMKRKDNLINKAINTMKNIEDDINFIAKNSEQANKHMDELVKSSKSKLPTIISIIALFITFIGVIVTFCDITVWELIQTSTKQTPQYEIYLNSEYSKLKTYVETDITAILNFDTDSISITAYLDSIKDGDTLKMVQKNEIEWHKKVIFEKTGTYKVVATAMTPSGDIIENSIEIEVISPSGDIINQIYNYIN